MRGEEVHQTSIVFLKNKRRKKTNAPTYMKSSFIPCFLFTLFLEKKKKNASAQHRFTTLKGAKLLSWQAESLTPTLSVIS